MDELPIIGYVPPTKIDGRLMPGYLIVLYENEELAVEYDPQEDGGFNPDELTTEGSELYFLQVDGEKLKLNDGKHVSKRVVRQLGAAYPQRAINRGLKKPSYEVPKSLPKRPGNPLKKKTAINRWNGVEPAKTSRERLADAVERNKGEMLFAHPYRDKVIKTDDPAGPRIVIEGDDGLNGPRVTMGSLESYVETSNDGLAANVGAVDMTCPPRSVAMAGKADNPLAEMYASTTVFPYPPYLQKLPNLGGLLSLIGAL